MTQSEERLCAVDWSRAQVQSTRNEFRQDTTAQERENYVTSARQVLARYQAACKRRQMLLSRIWESWR